MPGRFGYFAQYGENDRRYQCASAGGYERFFARRSLNCLAQFLFATLELFGPVPGGILDRRLSSLLKVRNNCLYLIF
jgi:hypothetical protein